MLFPAAFSPAITSLAVSPLPAASSIRLHTSTVSGLTSVCGLWKSPHVWLDLNASLARSWSMATSGILSTLPALSGAPRLVPSIRDRPCTGMALLLDSTMRLRQALRSPGPGVLGRTRSFFFLNLDSCMRLPVRWWTPALGFGMEAWTGAVVEKWCAVEGTVLVVDVAVVGAINVVHGTRCLVDDDGDGEAAEGLRRHLQQFDEVIMIMPPFRPPV